VIIDGRHMPGPQSVDRSVANRCFEMPGDQIRVGIGSALEDVAPLGAKKGNESDDGEELSLQEWTTPPQIAAQIIHKKNV